LAAFPVLAFLGCGFQAEAPSQSRAQTSAKAPGRATAEFSGPQRLTRIALARQRELVREPLEVPMDETWRAEGPARVTAGNGTLHIAAGEVPVVLTRDVHVPAEEFTELRLRMRVSRGTTCNVSWQSDLEPDVRANRGVSTPVFPDNEFHTYTLPLTPPMAETWLGMVQRIRVAPSDLPAEIEIAGLAFAFTPPKAPLRMTIGTETHEALVGTQPPWRIRIPRAAVFETAVGLLPRSWIRGSGDGVEFRVVLDAESADGAILAKRRLSPHKAEDRCAWIYLRADLGDYAGEDAVLHLEVDPLQSRRYDYASWGNPTIFSRSGAPDGIPVILFSCDTLRADHVACYGYERETTPHLDGFAREAVLFEAAIAPETWTPTSHMTMLTGLHPKHHGLTYITNLGEETVTVAQVLSEAEYFTAGYVSHTWLMLPTRGFSHGFDVYSTPSRRDNFREIFITHGLARQWLESHTTPNVFLFLHNYDIHSKFANGGYETPYYPPGERFRYFSKDFAKPPSFDRENGKTPRASDFLKAANAGKLTITDEEREYMIALYDDCIRAVDQAIFDFLEGLKTLGLYDSALIIVTSDHGEAFGEHLWYLHDQTYEECCRVPLIIKFPHGRFAGQRVRHVVELADLFPTVLEVVGVPPQRDIDGQSLLALIEGRIAPRLYTYTMRRTYGYETVRSGEWKLHRTVRGQPFELYNLADDPSERKNLYDQAPPVLVQLREELERFYAPSETGWHFVFVSGDDDSEVRLVLRSDGPLQGAELRNGEFGARPDSIDFVQNTDHVTANLRLPPPDRDEVVVSPFSPTQRMFLSLKSDAGLVVVAGQRRSPALQSHQVALDPAAGPFAKPENEAVCRGDIPTLFAWYHMPTVERTAAERLLEEAIEQLQALGYGP